MAEAPNGNGERLQKAAENALLVLLSRWIVVLLVPATLGLGGYIGNRVVGQLDEFIKETRAQHEADIAKVNGIDVRLSVTETRVDALERRQ